MLLSVIYLLVDLSHKTCGRIVHERPGFRINSMFVNSDASVIISASNVLSIHHWCNVEAGCASLESDSATLQACHLEIHRNRISSICAGGRGDRYIVTTSDEAVVRVLDFGTSLYTEACYFQTKNTKRRKMNGWSSLCSSLLQCFRVNTVHSRALDETPDNNPFSDVHVVLNNDFHVDHGIHGEVSI